LKISLDNDESCLENRDNWAKVSAI